MHAVAFASALAGRRTPRAPATSRENNATGSLLLLPQEFWHSAPPRPPRPLEQLALRDVSGQRTMKGVPTFQSTERMFRKENRRLTEVRGIKLLRRWLQVKVALACRRVCDEMVRHAVGRKKTPVKQTVAMCLAGDVLKRAGNDNDNDSNFLLPGQIDRPRRK